MGPAVIITLFCWAVQGLGRVVLWRVRGEWGAVAAPGVSVGPVGLTMGGGWGLPGLVGLVALVVTGVWVVWVVWVVPVVLAGSICRCCSVMVVLVVSVVAVETGAPARVVRRGVVPGRPVWRQVQGEQEVLAGAVMRCCSASVGLVAPVVSGVWAAQAGWAVPVWDLLAMAGGGASAG